MRVWTSALPTEGQLVHDQSTKVISITDQNSAMLTAWAEAVSLSSCEVSCRKRTGVDPLADFSVFQIGKDPKTIGVPIKMTIFESPHHLGTARDVFVAPNTGSVSLKHRCRRWQAAPLLHLQIMNVSTNSLDDYVSHMIKIPSVVIKSPQKMLFFHGDS